MAARPPRVITDSIGSDGVWSNSTLTGGVTGPRVSLLPLLGTEMRIGQMETGPARCYVLNAL